MVLLGASVLEMEGDGVRVDVIVPERVGESVMETV